jgi:hypothetical protein
VTRVLMFRDGSVISDAELQEVATDRAVKPFLSLDEVWRDVSLRGDCVKFDLHGLWWSVPMELNIHEIDAQIGAELVRMDCAAFPSQLGETYRPTIA